MRAGRLRHRIAIEQRTESRDGYGGVTETWTVFVNAWAAIEPVGGREYFNALAAQSETTVKIILRYQSGITTKMRVVNDDRYYDIEAVIDTASMDRELVLMCKEGINDGG